MDILVANAGISSTATIEDTTVENFDALFAVNVRAPFFLFSSSCRSWAAVPASCCFLRSHIDRRATMLMGLGASLTDPALFSVAPTVLGASQGGRLWAWA